MLNKVASRTRLLLTTRVRDKQSSAPVLSYHRQGLYFRTIQTFNANEQQHHEKKHHRKILHGSRRSSTEKTSRGTGKSLLGKKQNRSAIKANPSLRTTQTTRDGKHLHGQGKTQRNKIVTPLSQRSNIKTRNLQPKSKGRWPATDPTPSCANNDTTQNNGNENKRKWDTPTASSSPPP